MAGKAPGATLFPYTTLFRSVAGKQRKLVQAKLKRPARSGVISVREASGKTLDVVVDGAVVGKTPWQGTVAIGTDRKSTRLNSSHSQISYAAFCLKKKKSRRG